MLDAWRLKDFDLGQGEAAGAASGADEAGWIDVAVPGDSYRALHAAGRLPDPFAGANEAACQWVAEREWWWRTTFHAERPAADERLDDGAAELWITNDTAEEAAVDAVVELAFFAGGAAWSERVTAGVPAGASRAVCRLLAERPTSSVADPGAAFLHVRETCGRFFDNRLFFAAIKDLSRPSRVTPAASFEASAGALTVTLRASDFDYFTHLLTPFEAARFSDNYIDLRAGEERAITITHPGRALTPADVTLRSR